MIHCNQVSTAGGDDQPFSIGTLPSIPIILTTSIVAFAVDAAVTRLRRGSYQPIPQTPEKTAPTPPPCQSLARFVDKTRDILADIQAIEKQLNNEKRRRSYQSPNLIEQNKRIERPTHRRSKTEPSYAFSAFCDQLLLTNKIWKQEKELNELRTAVKAKSRAQKDTSFQMFCDQLLLWNKIWKLERDVVALGKEKERVERERVSAITRAAERMVQGVQKERMVEELVEELIDEVNVTKAEVAVVRAEHERELAELNGEWLKDYKRVTQELAQLKLAQEARLVEQEVSNGMEDSLIESLREGQRKIRALEERIEDYASADEVTLNDADEAVYRVDGSDENTIDNELDSISELSSSCTCVSFGGATREQMSAVTEDIPKRRRCVSQSSSFQDERQVATRQWNFSTSIDKSTRRAIAERSLATRTRSHSGRPLAVRSRTISFFPTSPTESGIKGGGIAKRAPWRA